MFQGMILYRFILKYQLQPLSLNMSLSLMTEWRSHVLKAGGAIPCVDPVTVIPTKDFIKIATRPLESVAAR